MVFLELYSRHPFGKQLWRVTGGSTSKIGDEAFISGLGFWVWGGWVFSRTER